MNLIKYVEMSIITKAKILLLNEVTWMNLLEYMINIYGYNEPIFLMKFRSRITLVRGFLRNSKSSLTLVN